ncbi:MAG: hypothetical protein ACE5HX_18525 [bacterium]
MSSKLRNIINLPISEFNEHAKSPRPEVTLQEARLIPIYQLGHEMALTSVFLSSLRLVKEFRKLISSSVNLISSGKIYVYTEAEFRKHEEKTVDGLILVVKGGKIKDAALLEMKNNDTELKEQQLTNYLKIAEAYRIPKLITISNQFVSHPTQWPVNVKTPKKVELYHLSWSYILTMARILLFKNGTNIEDEDQIEIMKEIVNYFEDKRSGVQGFTLMKRGWDEISKKINTRAPIRNDDNDLTEAVESWLQEEKDMALKLSRELGLLVGSGEAKYKDDLRGRIDSGKNSIIKNKSIESVLKVEGAASPIYVKANFGLRNIEMRVNLQAPQDGRTLKGQIGWLRSQINNCRSKNKKLFGKIENEIRIEINVKYFENTKNPKIRIEGLDDIINQLKGKEIKEFGIIQIKDMAQNFSNRKKFIAEIETMLSNYYGVIVQYLKKWEKPAPKMNNRAVESQETE